MRNGDRRMTVNGVETCIPRELPFPHDGFGQDGEWFATDYTSGAGSARLWWLPRLCGSPDIRHIGPGDALRGTRAGNLV